MSCSVCNKHITILEMITSKCKCNKNFCNKHKFYLDHNCSYNYKLDAPIIVKIEKNKVEKI